MKQAIAGMSWEEIAKSAYLAYAATTDNKNYQGLPMPEFENLTPAIKIAWEASVRQTANCLSEEGDKKAGELNEGYWKEWSARRKTGE